MTMANLPTEISSHEKADNAFGQNGYQGSSSLMPEKTKPPIPKVSPPVADAALIAARGDNGAADTIEGRVGARKPVPVAHGMATAPKHSIPRSTSAAKPVRASEVKRSSASAAEAHAPTFPGRSKRSGHHLKRRMK
jgi:hypothetical protein